MKKTGANTFTITLKGDESDASLRLSALIQQLNALQKALTQVGAALAAGDALSDVYFRVTKITMQSPATLTVEAVSPERGVRYTQRLVTKFGRDLASVSSGRRPKRADYALLEAYRGLVQPLRKHVESVSLKFNEVEVELHRSLDAQIDEILGPDQIEIGSIEGSLELIDIHNKNNIFRVYPVVGPASVRCRFQQAQRSDVLRAIDSHVRVSGALHFKQSEKFPHLLSVSKLEILENNGEPPPLSALRGIAPDAYSGRSSVEHVDLVRNGDW